MKKIYLFLLCSGCLFTLQTFAQVHPSYQISGRLTGVPGNKLAISYINEAAGVIECIDTIALTGNGEFGFDTPFPAITPIIIEAMPTPQTTDEQRCKRITIFTVPGEQAIIDGTLDNYTISGNSTFFKDLNELQQAMKSFINQYKAIQAKYQPLLKANKKNKDSITTQYHQKMNAFVEAQSDSAFQYIKAHPDQEASATLLMSIAPRNRLQALDLLSDKAKTERIVTFYQSLLLLDATKETEEEDTTKAFPQQLSPAIQPGDIVPEFTLKDLNDKDFTLSSLRGRYVVLDFWGNWCGWCIKGIPDMKKAYDKHKDKVEFVGIDCRDTKEVWLKAVAKYELPWTQVYNNGVPHDVAAQYSVEGYPSKYIIDPEGKLVRRIVGEDPEFYTFLDELLK